MRTWNHCHKDWPCQLAWCHVRLLWASGRVSGAGARNPPCPAGGTGEAPVTARQLRGHGDVRLHMPLARALGRDGAGHRPSVRRSAVLECSGMRVI